MRFTGIVLELVFILTISGVLWVLFNIPFAKAGPFSFIIIGALGFSLICIVQGYVHLIGKYELPLGRSFVRLFVRRPSRELQKYPIRQRSFYHRR